MNKYELAVVLSAKTLKMTREQPHFEKVKGYITRFGGNIVDVDEWGKKRLAYEIQKSKEGFYYFTHFRVRQTARTRLSSHPYYGAGCSLSLRKTGRLIKKE